MRWTRRLIATVLAALLAGVAANWVDGATASAIGVVDPAVEARLAAAGPQDMVDVLVVLPRQVDVLAIRGGTRAQRRASIIRALQATALADQTGLRSFLAGRRAQGLVTSVVPLWIVNGIEVTARPSVISELAARPDVRAIRPNRTIQVLASTTSSATAEANVAATGAPAMWDLGFRGQGVVVANMDTGVDATHPDLAGRWRGGTNSWYDPNGEHPTTPVDVNGHGTWTMGLMVGGDAGGTSIGIAPEARWIAVKIFNDRGTATTSAIHLGFQWLLDPDHDPATDDAPDVVNDSWTMSVSGCNLDFQPDLRSLRASGILPVFAAGNYGPGAGTVMSPANNPEAFAVGSVDANDAIDPSSGRGPSACGQAVDPELVAPGVNVRTTDLYGGYAVESGTSMAAPHAAGALALLLGTDRSLSADRQAAALEASAVDLGGIGPDNTYGSGRLDVLGAYRWLVTTPDFSLSTSPSTASTTPGGSASYTVDVAGVNGFTGDVALSASGLPDSQASWSFSPPVVAGGAGTAQLSVSVASALAPGAYPVTITGQSGSLTHTATVTLELLGPPDFGLSVSPSAQTVVAASSISYTVTVSSINGFAGTVALSLSGLPSSVGTATISPASVSGAGSAQLTVATLASAPAGTYPLTMTGTNGASTHTASIALTVSAAPDFSLYASPASTTIRRGQSASYTVTVASIGGFTGSVSLGVRGLPSGARSSFSPNPVTPPGTSTLVVKTASYTSRGTFALRVTGTNGTLGHQVTVTLTIT